jgi:chemotaxis protein CheX
MKAELVNPFIESVQEVFSTMLGTQAKRGKVGITDGEKSPGELVALIGISGRATGNVALSLPASTALSIIGQLMSETYDSVTEDVIDGVAEMVNMIAGGAKAKMNVDGDTPMDLSLPTVVSGDSYKVKYPTKTIWLEVPFECDYGPFIIRITFENE